MKKDILYKLNLIKRKGLKYHSAQIIMTQLLRLAQQAMRFANDSKSAHKVDRDLFTFFHEAMINQGVISRTEAMTNTNAMISGAMNSISDDAGVVNAGKTIGKGLTTYNKLVKGYKGVNSQWLAYDIGKRGLYHQLTLQRSMKTLNEVIDDVNHDKD